MNSNKIYYDEITGIIYIDLGNNLKYPISNLSYTRNKFEELKSNISEFGKLNFKRLEKNISEINGYLEYCKKLGLYSDDISIKLIEKGGKILDIKNLVEKIKIDHSNGESLLQAIVSRRLELGTTNLVNSAYMAIALATENPMFIIIGNELAESNGSYANASIDYLWDPEKRDILFQALRSLSGSEIEYETINNTKYGYIKYQILTSGQTKIIGDINVVSKIWNAGNGKIDEFEVKLNYLGTPTDKAIIAYYSNNKIEIMNSNLINPVLDVNQIKEYFPDLYNNNTEIVVTNGFKAYKLYKYNFNSELNRRNFSADELINANPNFNGRISDDGTFVLLGVGESIDDIKYPFIGNEKNNIINGDENDNRILGNGGNDIIYGGSGFENIDGGDGDDIISTGDPDSSFLDFILNKHDIVHGGNGNDIIYGGKGNDKLYGDEGNDNIYGYEGNDEIDAGNGDDLIDGGNGNDTINGGDGNDILKGGKGNDTLIGGAGSDTLSGGDGDDTLSAGDSEKDKLSGGSGNDTLIGYKNVYLDGGTGFDTYYIKSGKIKDSDGKGIINDIKGTFNETEKGTEIYTQGAYTYDNRSKKLTGNGLDISVDLSGGRFSIELVRTDYERPKRDPLILDLDGDGIETTSVNNGVNYDFLADGIKEKTGWVGKDDGFLVLDKNSNGKIDNDSEFFGEGQSLKNGEKSTGGFESLGEYDGNGDKIINSNDEIYSQLRIWQDKNQNGITDEGELKTLKELGIKSISLEALQKNITTSTGNILREEGTYTLESGEERKIGEFLFQTSVLEATEEELELTDEVKNLADINGYGGNFSLHQAMMRDSELKNLVIEFGNLEGAQDKLIKVGEIVNKWYGESTKDKIVKIYGETYFNNMNNRGESISAPIFSKIESDIIKNVYFSLIQQTSLKGIFDEVNPSFNEESKEWEIDLGNIKEIFEKEIETNGSKGLKKLEEFISAYQMIYSEKSNFEEFKKYFSEKYNRGFMEIGENINIKIGSIGDDTLNSGEGSDILVGGIGNDKLNGGAGDDIYIF
ncbi:MAG: hypothetical protein JXA99_05665, partial [Candidatus Lokiarchaeota archaeon]|nr:hypothetical protein [Candidatus Lokiarchaeota archaeon]